MTFKIRVYVCGCCFCSLLSYFPVFICYEGPPGALREWGCFWTCKVTLWSLCVCFTVHTGHSLLAWLTPLLYKFGKLHGNLISAAALCLPGELAAVPSAERHICDDFPAPPVLPPVFSSFALSFFFSFWSGREVPLSLATEIIKAVMTCRLLLFKPTQTKHIQRGAWY